MNDRQPDTRSLENVFSENGKSNTRVKKFRDALPQSTHWLIAWLIGSSPKKIINGYQIIQALLNSDVATSREEANKFLEEINQKGFCINFGGELYCIDREGDTYRSYIGAQPKTSKS